MTSGVQLSIIIPTLGEAAGLSHLLKSLENQKLDFNFEVLIVDNSLDQRIRHKLQNYLDKSLLNSKLLVSSKKGVNFARNLGIRESKGSILLFIDDDCWLNDLTLLAKHYQFHLKFAEYFAIGGRYALDLQAGFIDSCYHEIQMKWLSEGIIDSYSGQTQYLIGGHFSVKKIFYSSQKFSLMRKLSMAVAKLAFFCSQAGMAFC